MRQAILSGPVNRTLYSLTQPMVLGIMAVFFFNMVDTWFISLLGTESLAAVGFAMPVTMLVMNLAIGLGIAMSALIARAVGADGNLQAQRAAMAGLLLSLLLGVVAGNLLMGGLLLWRVRCYQLQIVVA